ncbi:MAG: hypothetical protein AAF465_06880 [Pseudomonadota bacterium]
MLHFSGVILLIILLTGLLWFWIGYWVASIERTRRLKQRETEWHHQLNTLRRDRDAFRDQVEVAHGKIRVLENRRADGKSPPRSPEDEAAAKAVTVKLQSQLDRARKQLSGFSQQVDALKQQSLAREDVLQQIKKKLTDTSRTLHDREQQLARLDSEAESAAVGDDATQIQRLRVRLQSATDAAEQDKQRLDHTIEEHMQTIGALRSELAKRDTQTGTHDNAQISALQQELDELKQENHDQFERIEQLSQGNRVVDHQRERLTQLKEALREQTASNETLTQSNTELEAKLNERNALIKRLKTSHVDESELEKRQQTLKTVIEHQELTVERLRDEARERNLQYERELKELRDAMSAQDDIVAQLRVVLDKPARAKSAAAKKPTESAPDAPHSGDLFAQLDEDTPSDATAPVVELYTEAPDQPDDLKKISGIGPAFEKALNNLGLYTFDQIAALTPNDIEWVAQELRSFPDRIINGRWSEQAKRLIDAR